MRRNSAYRSFWQQCKILPLAVCLVTIGNSSTGWAQGVDFFERKVRPLLIDKCGDCHGVQDPESELTLTTVQGIAAGGSAGAVLTPGNPEQSRLLEAVRYTSKLKMPPDGRLSETEIAIIETWIREGAALPGGAAPSRRPRGEAPFGITEEDRQWWAFQPIGHPVLPNAVRLDRVRTGVDRFILHKLEEHGLTLSPDADRRILVRRVTFNLTGLPPTPAEVQAFLEDSTPRAYERLVERLLASPQYGVRWGRRWLDLARYADTNGGGFDYVYPNAWHYRDYVVRAFNADKPYDQFLVEQLAGDLLPIDGQQETYVERLKATGLLTLAPKGLGMQDKEQMYMDVVDDQIDVLGRSLMGITLSCARCHDHKFDPISTQDYYALAGIFRSTGSLIDTDKNPSYWPERPLELPAVTRSREKYQARRDANAKTVAEVERHAQRRLLDRARERTPEYLFAATKIQAGGLSHDQAAQQGLVPSIVRRFVDHLAAAAKSAESPFAPLIALQPTSIEEVKNFLAASDEALAKLLGDKKAGPFVIGDEAAQFYDRDSREKLEQLAAESRRIERSRVTDPSLAMVAFDTSQPADLRVHIAGDRTKLGELARRDFPLILRRGSSLSISTGQSGRLELARWLTTDEHPLTARVFANHVWKWHFGAGLVPTPDNFGKLGERPSHPELLDWLARRLIDSKWSVKDLHRQIVLSSVYRQVSVLSTRTEVPKPNPLALDAGNRLLWRMNRQRLEGEVLRDTMLYVSGQLELNLGGTVNQWKQKTFSVDDQNAETANYDIDRRSIYLPVVRGAAVHEMLQLFDFGDPNSITPQRDVTTVAPQALFLMNSPFVLRQANRFAARLLSQSAMSSADRIQFAYELTLSRQPSRAEMARALAFVDRPAGDDWRLFCQMLLCLNEFAYVE